MKKITYWLVALLALCLVMPVGMNAQEKKKKKKKAKKEFVWDWDRQPSGNEKVDAYLMACDTLWNDITQYQENITAYEFKEDTLIMNEDEVYVMAWMQTKDNRLLSKAAANWQLVESVTSGISIVANSVQIATQTVAATTALPSLGLKALSYAKYVKAGPTIIGKAGNEIKEIVLLRQEQMKKWQAMRKGAVDPATLFPDLDPDLLKKFSKSYFIKKVPKDDPGYSKMITVIRQKSKEEMEKQYGFEEKAAQALQKQSPDEKSEKVGDYTEEDLHKLANGEV